MSPESITIFTDGAARGNPGPGGWGAIVIVNGKVMELGGREAHATNNRMELMGAIEGLKRVKDTKGRIFVYSDSTYIVLGMSEWVARWVRNGWKTAARKRVENQDLWERLLAAAEDKEIQWKRIDGHAGVAGNERCDKIATAFADGKNVSLYSGPLEKCPIKHILDILK